MWKGILMNKQELIEKFKGGLTYGSNYETVWDCRQYQDGVRMQKRN